MLQKLITDNIDLWTSAETSRSTAGRGSNGKTELTGIKKLRELILELAVRGLLVPQDPNDEPASVLLEKIAAEKEALIKAGKIKKQKPLPAIAEDEKPFDLPDGWEWVRIGNLVYLEMGQSPPSHSYNQIRDGMPFFQGKADFGELYPTARYWCVKPQKISYPGDILLSVRAPVGPTNITNIECCIGRGLAALRPLADMPTGYIHTLMRRNHRKLEALGTGTTFVAVSKTIIDGFCMPVAPLPEEHRIVAKVDELMALCDQLEQQHIQHSDTHHTLVTTLLDSLCQAVDNAQFQTIWSQLAANFDTLFTTEASIDQLKQTILQLAVMGKLVPQDPNDEPASVLLEKIAAEKEALIKAGKIKKLKEFSINHEGNHLAVLPYGWEQAQFGNILFNRDAERIPLSVDERRGRRGEFDYYGASGVIDSIDSFLFDKPLLLIGEDGANLINRSTKIAFIAKGKYWVNNHAHVLDAINEELLEYICLHINAISLEPYITGTAQPKMNQAKMNSIFLSIPPEAEQHRIVAKVDELMTLCDQLKVCLNQAQTTQQHLAHAIVEQAVA